MDWGDEPFLAGRHRAGPGSRAELRRALRAGSVRRVFRGVYVAVGVVDDQRLRTRAAALVLPAGMVVSDRSAAWLHGVDAFDPVSLDLPPDVEMVAVGGARATHRPGVAGGNRELLPEDIEELDGVLVTTPSRTAVDLGRLRGRAGAFAAMSMLGRVGGFGPAELARYLPRLAGHRGVVQLRDLAPHVAPDCASPGECWTLLAILDAGLHRPRAQHEVWVPSWGLAILDFAYPHLKVAVEYDGEEFHGEGQRAHDDARRAALRALGWTVIVVRKADLAGAARDQWLAELRAQLDRAALRRRYAAAPRAARPW